MTIKAMPSRGDMKRRITIEQRVVAPMTDRGGTTYTWTQFTQAWAFFDDWKGKKLFADQTQRPTMVMRIVIPYQPGITANMRVNYNGRLMNIETTYDVAERHEYIEMYVTEGAPT